MAGVVGGRLHFQWSDRSEMTSVNDSGKRKYPRRPAAVPVSLRLGEVVASESAYINDISAGGASFNAMLPLEPGDKVLLQIPPSDPVVQLPARVVWSRKMSFEFAIGVEFTEVEAGVLKRLVEMVQRIDAWRDESLRAGRPLTVQEATLKWIELFGRDHFAAD